MSKSSDTSVRSQRYIDKSRKKNSGKYLSAASAMVALSAFVPNPQGVMAQTPTATFNATATVVEPIGITAKQDIHFGKFVAGDSGAVLVSTAGVQSDTGADVTGLDGGAQNGIVRFTAAPVGATNTLQISAPDISGATGIQLAGTNTASVKVTITKLTFAALAAITKVNNVSAAGTFKLTSLNPNETIRFVGGTGFPQDLAFGGVLDIDAGKASQVYTGTFQLLITFP